MPTATDLRLTNVEILDDDHEQLLFALQEIAYGEAVTRAGMDRLIAQVNEHFEHELPYLQQVGGALMTHHLAAHGMFLDRLTTVREACEGDQGYARAELVNLLARFITHTNTDDIDIAEALKTITPRAAEPALSLDDIVLN